MRSFRMRIGLMLPGDFKRGDILWVNLDPVVGSEMAKTRPCLVLQCEPLNARSQVTTVAPLTSRPPKHPNRFMLEVSPEDSGLTERSWILCHHLRTVSLQRIKGTAGHLHSRSLARAGELVKLALGLSDVE